MAYDMHSRPKADRSFTALLNDLAAETGLLLRQEIGLFKAELGEKLAGAGLGIGLLVTGALVAFGGWLALIAAAVLGLSAVLAPWLAALIVGIVVLACGGALALFGKSRMRPEALVPRRTLQSLRENEAWVREQFR